MPKQHLIPRQHHSIDDETQRPLDGVVEGEGFEAGEVHVDGVPQVDVFFLDALLDAQNLEELGDEVVGKQVDAQVFVERIVFGSGSAEGEFHEVLQSRGNDVVDALAHLVLGHVHELDDEIPAIQQEIVLEGFQSG